MFEADMKKGMNEEESPELRKFLDEKEGDQLKSGHTLDEGEREAQVVTPDDIGDISAAGL